MKKEKLVYVEPADYFPEDIRKKHGLGEYAAPKRKDAEQENIYQQRAEQAEWERTLSPNDLTLDGPGTIPFKPSKTPKDK